MSNEQNNDLQQELHDYVMTKYAGVQSDNSFLVIPEDSP